MKIPTYPARPLNGGPLHVALPKSGEWFVEPKYNGWRALVHAPTGTMFNREGQQLTIASQFKPALARLATFNLEWFDCEALERRHNIGRGSLIILDYLPTTAPQTTYKDRRYLLLLLAAFYKVPIHKELNEPIPNDSVVIVPTYEEAGAKQFWKILKQCNTALGCEFYEGLVAKRADSPYPFQTINPKQETPHWMKHRWAW